MISIAICDDDKELTGTVEQCLRKISAEQSMGITCEVFFDGLDLVRAVTEQGMGFDLVYMDIEMADMDGISAALALREAKLPTIIVYMSCHEERMREVFLVEPFRFLLKPIEEAEFRAVFLSAWERIREQTGYYTFSYKKACYRIPFGLITYFESRRRIIIVHLAGKTVKEEDSRQDWFYGKMGDIEEQVADLNGRFLRLHQSFLVNFDYIRVLAATEAQLLDGRRIPVSEDRRQGVLARFRALSGETDG